MSFHICLVTKDLNNDHPSWDDSKLLGDRFIAKLLSDLPSVQYQCDDVTVIERPDDFGKWREVLAALPSDRANPDRFPQMLDLLEQNEDYWIYLSI